MTTIVILKNNDNYAGFECFGHSGYADVGSDIVCASISTLVQSTAMGIKYNLKIDVKIESDENKGSYILTLPKILDKKQIDGVKLLMDTMKMAIIDLENQFPKNIKLEEKTYVY